MVRWPRISDTYSETSGCGACVRGSGRRCRRAEKEAAALEQIPKASIMGGMRRCLVFTGSIDAVPDLTIGGSSSNAELVVARRSRMDRGQRARRTVDLRWRLCGTRAGDPERAADSRRCLATRTIGSTGSATGSTPPDSSATLRSRCTNRGTRFVIRWPCMPPKRDRRHAPCPAPALGGTRITGGGRRWTP